MNTGTFLVIGIMVGVMIAAWFLSRKTWKKECEYDEMQLKIRARGYQIGFYTALGLMLALILLWEVNCLTVVTPGFAIYTAMIISVTVFVIYCILNDAFLAIRGKADRYFMLFGLFVLLEGFIFVRSLMDGEILENGKLTFGSGAPAVMAICFLAILITLAVKTFRNRKEAQE